ncbi:MAG: T9SS type A sorting domain-containing protein [Bacteroidetes bacterium]|nr:T9SS type A sorting domain-containing protein [Bacteroidota bacterium]
MKHTFTFLFAIAFSASAITYISNDEGIKKTKRTGNGTEEGMVHGASKRALWERKRLADPATGRIPDNIRQKELAFAATLPSDANLSRTINFTNRGPWNVGGRTRAFGIDVSNENRILAGSASGGMWLSVDGGATWNMTNTMSQLKNATCLVQDKRPGHTNVWYYGSGEAYGASASAGGAYYLGDGMFKSTDGGVTWTQITATAGGNPQQFSSNWQLFWNVANDNSAHDTISEVYAATYGAVYRSVNGGTSWTAVRTGGSYFTDVAVTSTGVVYTTLSDDGSQKGIWRSTDGVTFTNITPTGFPTAYNRIVIGINPSNENEVYFLANTPGSGKETVDWQGNSEWNSFYRYTYVTGDGAGANGTWDTLSQNLPNSGGMFDKWQVQGSYDMIVRVHPTESNIVYIGGTNLYRSTSAFNDSTNTTFIGGYEQFSALPVINSYANHHPDQHWIEFLPSNPYVMFSANDGGVFKTTNDTASSITWQSLNNGYLTTMFYTVAIDHATPNNNIIVAGAQDNGSWYTNSANPTDPWVTPRGGDGSYCAIADNQSMYYFSIQNGKMMKATLDANGNRTAHARIDPIGLEKPQFINPYTLDPNNNNIMYLAGGKYLWRNDDLSGIPLANNWDSISTNWVRFADSVPTANSEITAVTACKVPANRVYYGTDKKRIYKVDNANVGTPTPVDISPTSFPSAGNMSCIAVDPNDGDNVLVVFSNYNLYSLFYTSDAGANWTKVGGNLEANINGTGSGPSILWASIIPVSDGVIYMVAGSTGVYATDTLNGTSTVWVQQGANTIGNAVCDMIDYRLSDGLVVVATHSNGIFSANITSVNDIVSIKDIENSKEELYLTNYPNPMMDQTTIEYKTNKRDQVTLSIWDECGRLIETPVNTIMPAGTHNYVFNKKNLKAGLYYYSLMVGDRRKTNKLIITN